MCNAGLSAGLVGLGLTYTLTMIDYAQYTVRLSAEVDNIVRRIKYIQKGTIVVAVVYYKMCHYAFV